MAHNLFLDNAYLVLGLDVDASEKDIVRRGRELDKILEIGEKPIYEEDFYFSQKRRTKKNVETSIRRLLDVKNEVNDTFFWFNPHTSIDRKAMVFCKNGDWRMAISIWEEKIKESPNSANCYAMIRNKAVAESIYYSESHSKKWLRAALKDWCYLIDSDGQWNVFLKVFRIKNPSIEENIVSKFREKAKDYLANYFFDIINSSDAGEDDLEALNSLLGTYGSNYEDDVIKPKIEDLRKLILELDDWRKRIKKNEEDDADTLGKVNSLREKIDSVAGSIQELGENVWGRGDIKNLRNDCSNAINYLCNELYGQDEIKENIRAITTISKLHNLGYDIAPEGSGIERQIRKNLEVVRSDWFYIKHKDDFELLLIHLQTGNIYPARIIAEGLLKDPQIDEKSADKLNDILARLGFSPRPVQAVKQEFSNKTPSIPEHGEAPVVKPISSDGIATFFAVLFWIFIILIIIGAIVGNMGSC